jgi:hypothetical protein
MRDYESIIVSSMGALLDQARAEHSAVQTLPQQRSPHSTVSEHALLNPVFMDALCSLFCVACYFHSNAFTLHHKHINNLNFIDL